MLSASRRQSDPRSADAYSILPVWRRLSLQLVVLTAALLIIVLLGEFIQPRFASGTERLLALALAPAPLILWLYFSVLPESRVDRPRRRLIGVAVVSALTASAIGLPLAQGILSRPGVAAPAVGGRARHRLRAERRIH